MKVTYNKYYQTENLFGEPYPELIEFMSKLAIKGKVLDLGCGQGRDAIPLARLGYAVTGIDNSKVGIDQMNAIAKSEKLTLIGHVGDIYTYDQFDGYDIILLDSMFHFQKNDKEKETRLIKNIISQIKDGCLVVVCIQDTGNKVEILNQALGVGNERTLLADKKFVYTYADKESGHTSDMNYRMIVIRK